MKHRTSLGLVLLPVLALASCDGDDVDDVDFRNGHGNVDLGGDGDIAIYDHPAANEDQPIWQWHTGNVHSGSAQGPLIIKVDDTTIRDANDVILCTREGDALMQRIRAGGHDGPVLYTVMGREVYAGEPADGEAPLYRFQGRHVVEGRRGPPLVSADTHIQFASSMRKLTIVSLIEGECGGPGL
jgi:hypothetical protein